MDLSQSASLRVREHVGETGQRDEGSARRIPEVRWSIIETLAHNKPISVRPGLLHDNEHTEAALHSTGSPYGLRYAHTQGIQIETRGEKNVTYKVEVRTSTSHRESLPSPIQLRRDGHPRPLCA